MNIKGNYFLPNGNRTKQPGLAGLIIKKIGRENFLPIPWVYGEIVKKISPGEKVRIIVEAKEHRKKARKVLKDVDVEFR